MSLYERQLELEQDSVVNGLERYLSAREKDDERGRGADTPEMNSLLGRYMPKLIPALAQLQSQADTKFRDGLTKGTRLAGWEIPISAMSIEMLAYLSLKSAIIAATDKRTVQTAAVNVGLSVHLQLHWDEVRKAEAKEAKARDYSPPNRIQMLKRTVREVNPKSVRKWLKKLDDLGFKGIHDRGARKQYFQTGAAMLACIHEYCPGIIEERTHHTTRMGKSHTTRDVHLTKEFIEEVKAARFDNGIRNPWLVPMVHPPLDWKIAGNSVVTGGYLSLKANLVKRTSYRHTFVGDVSSEATQAINAVQRTPWRINQDILSIATECVQAEVGPIPYEGFREFPAKVSDAEWDAMTREQRGVVKHAREAVHSHNNRAESKMMSTQRILGVAHDFAEEDALYFPHSMDWRGRAYPMPQDLHPQADDFAKSMLTFADTKPLGSRGYSWLMYHTANTYGVDKVDRDSQETWCLLHEQQIVALAHDPMGNRKFWEQADEPWQFLAACIELTQAWDSGDPSSYECSLPVSVDGSCNGLQHLSAMGLDPVGAKAVNLQEGDRQDIYQIVADKVNYAIEYPGTDSDPAVKAWYGNVSRKTVKRGVMTTPYGLTSVGMRDQLLQDGMCDNIPGDRMQNANYLRDRMKEAIGGTLVKGTEIMSWMQAWAKLLANDDKPISWATPIGLRVTQSYYKPKMQSLQTLLGRLRFMSSGNDDRTINSTKQVLSIAPNIIHSFDASHMMMTVNRMERRGEHSYSMVHDSFGTHACDVDVLLEETKEAFIEIYSQDWFESLEFDLAASLGRVPEEVPEVPARGTLDIEGVRAAEFFFA